MRRTATRVAKGDRALIPSWQQSHVGEWAKVLATFPLFEGVSRRRLRKLVREATLVEFAPGEVVRSSPERADVLHVIVGGSARVLGQPAARLRTGDYYGESALLDSAPRSAVLIATDELHVMRLTGQSFLQLAHDHPKVSLTLLRNLSAQFRRLETQAAAAR